MKISEIERHSISILPVAPIDGRVDDFVLAQCVAGSFKIVKSGDEYEVQTNSGMNYSLKGRQIYVNSGPISVD